MESKKEIDWWQDLSDQETIDLIIRFDMIKPISEEKIIEVYNTMNQPMSNTKQPISANKDYTKDEAEKLFEVKQPPQELVEKMKEIMGKTVPYENAVNLRAESLAQIAVSYEQEQKALIGQDLVRLVQENRELREKIKKDKKISEPYFLFFDWVMSGQSPESAKEELGL